MKSLDSGLQLRRIYREYFNACVQPALLAGVRDAFSTEPEAALLLSVRFGSEARFIPSEVLYWMMRDLATGTVTPSAEVFDTDDWRPAEPFTELMPALLTAVELLNMGRLIRDDIVDGHRRRQNFRSLHLELGKDRAWLVAEGLQGAAMELLALAGPTAECSTHLTLAASDYSRGVLSATFQELRFSHASEQGILKLGFNDFREIMQLKHGIGTLSMRMCAGLATHFASEMPSFAMFTSHRSSIESALAGYDVAGGIDNDWSEFSGRRGHIGWDRIPARRGKRSEIELGRPTIWNVFLQDEESVCAMVRAGLVGDRVDLDEINRARGDDVVIDLVGDLVERCVGQLLRPDSSFTRTMPLTTLFMQALRSRRMKTPESDAHADTQAMLSVQPVLDALPESHRQEKSTS